MKCFFPRMNISEILLHEHRSILEKKHVLEVLLLSPSNNTENADIKFFIPYFVYMKVLIIFEQKSLEQFFDWLKVIACVELIGGVFRKKKISRGPRSDSSELTKRSKRLRIAGLF